MPHNTPEKRKAYLLANKDKIHAHRQAKYLLNAEEQRAKSLAYIASHLEERRAYKIAYRLNNKDKMLAYYKERYARNAEKRRAKAKAYYYANIKEENKRSNAYKQAHPELGRAYRAKRRALKMNAPRNDLTHAQWLSIQAAQDHRCVYCGKRCKGRLSQDHITPLSRGGSHTLHNVVGACCKCNSKKHTGPPLCPVQPFLL